MSMYFSLDRTKAGRFHNKTKNLPLLITARNFQSISERQLFANFYALSELSPKLWNPCVTPNRLTNKHAGAAKAETDCSITENPRRRKNSTDLVTTA